MGLFRRLEKQARTWGILLIVAISNVCTTTVFGAETTGTMDLPKNSVSPSEEMGAAGSFRYKIDFSVPQWRGAEPSIGLFYDSSRLLLYGPDEIAGAGWRLSGLPQIRRASAGRGAPAFDESDIFLLNENELVPCGEIASPSCDSGGTHATWVESYNRIRRDEGANTWEVTRRDGTRYVFRPLSSWGSVARDASDEEQADLADRYIWLLSEKIDANNHSVFYTHSCKSLPDCNITSIEYAVGSIIFHWEDRPDTYPYGAGRVLGSVDTRLKTVEIRSSGQLLRAYAFNYLQSVSTGRSLLKSVQEFGRDAIISGGIINSGSSLPATVFEYSQPENVLSQKFIADINTPGFASGDFNGDGIADIVSSACGTSFYISSIDDSKSNEQDSYVTFKKVAVKNSKCGQQICERPPVESGLGGARICHSVTPNPQNCIKLPADSGGGWDCTPIPVSYSLGMTNVDSDAYEDIIWSYSYDRPIIADQPSGNKRKYSNISGLSLLPEFRTGKPIFGDGTLGGDSLQGEVKGVFGISLIDVEHWALADLTGDGRQELIHSPTRNSSATIYSWKENEFSDDTWTSERIDTYDPSFECSDTETGSDLPSAKYGISGSYYISNGITPIDINNDGKKDILLHRTHGYFEILKSNGSNFDSKTIRLTLSNSDYFIRSGDINGDGISDIVLFTKGENTNETLVSIFWGHNSSYKCNLKTSETIQVPFPAKIDAIGYYYKTTRKEGFFLEDINGDGRSDLIAAKTLSGQVVIGIDKHWKESIVYLSNGSGFNSSISFQGQLSIGYDFNGDGKKSLTNRKHLTKTKLDDEDFGNVYSIYIPGGTPDLLTKLIEPLGGEIAVTYDTHKGDSTTNVPYPLHVVKSIDRYDIRTGHAITSYAYEGGKWDWAHRRFLGFRKIVATLPQLDNEAAAPTVETLYRQDLASIGKIEQVTRRDGAGNVLSRQEESYDVQTDAMPYTSLNTASVSRIYFADGNRAHFTLRTFNEHGLVTIEREYSRLYNGENITDTDQRISSVSYHPNTDAYLVNYPAVKTTHNNLAGGPENRISFTFYIYDGGTSATPPTKGNITSKFVALDPTAPANGYSRTLYSYDSDGNVISKTDPVNGVTTYQYDGTYNLFPVEERNPLYALGDTRQKTVTSWNLVCGMPATQTDVNGNVTTYSYDALCRPLRIDRPDGAYERYAYLEWGNPGSGNMIWKFMPPADTAGGEMVEVTYFDGWGRQRYVRKSGRTSAASDQLRVETKYDKRGNVRLKSQPYIGSDTAYFTSFAYDALNRPISKINPDGTSVTTSYSAGSAYQAVTTVNEIGETVHVHSDAYGKEVMREQVNGAETLTTTITRDGLSRIVGVTDPGGSQWAYTYDGLGNQLQVSDPDHGIWTMTYDAASRLKTQLDANGNEIRYTYDALGRKRTRTITPAIGAIDRTTYAYDEDRSGYANVGHLTTASNAAATILTDFTARGQVAHEEWNVDGVARSRDYIYDVGDRLRQRRFSDGEWAPFAASGIGPDGHIVYDAAGRIKSIPNAVSNINYNANGEPVRLDFANCTHTDLTYDPLRLWLLETATVSDCDQASPPTFTETYTRDDMGRITAIASNRAKGSWHYSYDTVDRLLAAANDDDAALSEEFAYAANGNLTFKTGLGAYAYPTANALRPHAPLSVGGSTLSYDANGNMVSGRGRTIRYDGMNRPVSVTLGTTTVTYVYGPDDKRLKKIVGGSVALYLGADEEIVDAGTASETSIKHLTDNLRRKGSVTEGFATEWLYRDHLSSVRLMANAAGETVSESRYRAYGERSDVQTATIRESKGWIGERDDPEVGLTYLNARYYDPVIARFIQPDWWDPTDPAVGTNRYAYGLNNPILQKDPSGHAIAHDGDIDSSTGLSRGEMGGRGIGGEAGQWGLVSSQIPANAFGMANDASTTSTAVEPFDVANRRSVRPGMPQSPNARLQAVLDVRLRQQIDAVRAQLGMSPAQYVTPRNFEPNARTNAHLQETLNTLNSQLSVAGPRACTPGSTPTFTGAGFAPRTSLPNSIYEQRAPNGALRSRTFYDGNGNRFSRQDFDHSHGGMQPHEHHMNINGYGQPIGRTRETPLTRDGWD